MLSIRFFLCMALTCGFGGPALSQNVIVRAGFLADSIRVGDEVFFYVSARYKSDVQLLFPDTSFSFSPFEFHLKKYIPTTTRDSTSYDSAIYTLRTYEVNSVQSLRLPVYIVNPLDCTRVFSNRDTLYIRQLVKELPDSITSNLPLKATISYAEVQREINYPAIVIIISFVSLFTGVGWLAFAPAVARMTKTRKLKRLHQEFTVNYNRHVDALKTKFSHTDTESAIVLWKKYMEHLSKKPYTKLTTRETMQLENDNLLLKNLRAVDNAVYGHNENVSESLESLKTYADIRFQEILAEVKNGK